MKNYLKSIVNNVFTVKNTDINKLNSLVNIRNNNSNYFSSILPYSNKYVREGILNLKFKNNTQNAKIFGQILFDFLPEYLEDLKLQENFYNPIIINVPVSFFRKIKRGYNQNDLIVKYFMKNGGKNFIKWERFNLIKWKHTKPQSLMKNKIERAKNQKNAFKLLRQWKIKGKNIILFDDIYTTGSTVSEVKKILKKAGAKKVKIVVLAH